MPADFTSDDAGRVTASIPDAKGEFHSYELRPVWPGDASWAELLTLLRERKLPAGIQPDWACILTRLDTDESYLVAKIAPAKWFCKCSDWMYRSHKTPDGCKHCVFSRAFRAMLARAARPVPQGVAS